MDPLNLVAQAAHDLRNPASVIAGSAGLLRRSWAKLDEPQRIERVEAIEEQAVRLAGLAESLLDWAAIETGSVPLAVEPVDAAEVCLRAAARFGGVAVDVPGVRVLADATSLERVLANLLGNAGKYGAPPFVIDGRAGRDRVVISVADHGPGVPPHIAERLFEPFVRGVRGGDGSGLGLAIVRGLVEVQGGRVWYERGEPGSRFSVSLPAA